ncbi:hypothetical protein GCM10010123_35850 [Pilimelia anulata]|uniref:Uncharacterized protein n=1 Tax=Pilimelia anulata TaxID=53371 RepID=A0A8J3FAZ3_9ACTN|nr:hypothetical protein [Pilimelia anulata]GGK02720.1 hypothetical protein GCM10010123_35850 [Pilimelia anulata]
MLRRGDVLILRETEWRTGQGSILVTVTAVGDRRYDDGGWWISVKCDQITWRKQPEVRFIEIRAASVQRARQRVETPATGRCSVVQEGGGRLGRSVGLSRWRSRSGA